ncbi:hypothetical protein C8F01DRAFT_205338 [Mycena amicta]|nr:hypothetical protein C8F01DRAFT_118014 [Mycena amicta]KAJ7059814.1 hypothetical protein C8F01DRAFT_205338 [Mycena amicta]
MVTVCTTCTHIYLFSTIQYLYAHKLFTTTKKTRICESAAPSPYLFSRPRRARRCHVERHQRLTFGDNSPRNTEYPVETSLARATRRWGGLTNSPQSRPDASTPTPCQNMLYKVKSIIPSDLFFFWRDGWISPSDSSRAFRLSRRASSSSDSSMTLKGSYREPGPLKTYGRTRSSHPTAAHAHFGRRRPRACKYGTIKSLQSCSPFWASRRALRSSGSRTMCLLPRFL